MLQRLLHQAFDEPSSSGCLLLFRHSRSHLPCSRTVIDVCLQLPKVSLDPFDELKLRELFTSSQMVQKQVIELRARQDVLQVAEE